MVTDDDATSTQFVTPPTFPRPPLATVPTSQEAWIFSVPLSELALLTTAWIATRDIFVIGYGSELKLAARFPVAAPATVITALFVLMRATHLQDFGALRRATSLAQTIEFRPKGIRL